LNENIQFSLKTRSNLGVRRTHKDDLKSVGFPYVNNNLRTKRSKRKIKRVLKTDPGSEAFLHNR
jgi:hypothetical protein